MQVGNNFAKTSYKLRTQTNSFDRFEIRCKNLLYTLNKTFGKSKAFNNEVIIGLVITFAVFELDFFVGQKAASKGTTCDVIWCHGKNWNLAAMKIITELFGT